MKKLTAVIATALILSACKVGPFDLTTSIAIDNEVVFTTTSSIDEMKANNTERFSVADAPHNGTDPSYTQTQYPIVLVHGLYGFDDIFGHDYWYRIVEALELGGATVYTMPVPKLNSTEYRGEYLIAALEELSAVSGHSKFHLMGHSHGGPTTRYLIGTAPELLASVTTIGGVNAYGVDYIDEVIHHFEGFILGPIGQGMLNALAEIIEWTGGNKQNHQSFALASFRSLSAEGTKAFNTVHSHGLPANWDHEDFVSDYCMNGSDPVSGASSVTVNGHSIRLLSWSGIGVGTNVLDPLDLLINFAHEKLNHGAGDGFVDRCASHFGQIVRSDYDLDHVDQINQTFGMRRATSTNPLVIYRVIANKLKTENL